jgi:hypothetical protein
MKYKILIILLYFWLIAKNPKKKLLIFFPLFNSKIIPFSNFQCNLVKEGWVEQLIIFWIHFWFCEFHLWFSINPIVGLTLRWWNKLTLMLSNSHQRPKNWLGKWHGIGDNGGGINMLRYFNQRNKSFNFFLIWDQVRVE